MLDARGQLCPAPVIALARRMAAVKIGEAVEVWADDPAAGHDIPAWCRMTRQTLMKRDALDPEMGPGHRFIVVRQV